MVTFHLNERRVKCVDGDVKPYSTWLIPELVLPFPAAFNSIFKTIEQLIYNIFANGTNLSLLLLFIPLGYNQATIATRLRQRFIQPPRMGGELPPWNKVTSPLEKDHQLPRQGEYLFWQQLTRPLHANFLLQHETGRAMAFILLKIKIVGHHIICPYHCRSLWQCFRSRRWKTGKRSISCQNAPDCTKLRLKFRLQVGQM